MKTKQEREQLIKDINVLLNQAYDSTLDEIYALLKRIDDDENKQTTKNIRKAREDARINGTVSWEDLKHEIANERKKDVA
jgi:hypothetical protein